MTTMRAKMKVGKVNTYYENQDGSGAVIGEQLFFVAVCPSKFAEDGSAEENNNFSRWTPSANLSMYVANPALFGKFKEGDEFYLDFTPAT